jgi:O-antigen/teichoic acid export membrane protein
LLAAHAISAPHLSAVLRIGALMLFFDALNGAQTGALAGFEAFRTIAGVNLLVGLIAFPLLVAGAYFGGLAGAVWAWSTYLAGNWLLNHIALRKEVSRHQIPFRFVGCARERSVLWSFSLPAALSSVLIAGVHWVCGVLLVRQPGGYDQMGIFSAADQWYAMLLFLPNVLGAVVLPVLSDRLGQKKAGQSMQVLSLGIRMNALLVLPLVLLASVASPYIMRSYGEGFADAWPTLLVVLLTAGLLSMQTPAGQVIVASGRMWTGFLMNLGWAAMFVGGTLALLHLGSLGVAGGRAIGYAAHAAWTFAFVYAMRSKYGNRRSMRMTSLA